VTAQIYMEATSLVLITTFTSAENTAGGAEE